MADRRVIRLPDAYRDTYQLLAQMPSSVLSAFTAVIAEQAEGSSPSTLADALNSRSIVPSDVSSRAIIDALVSINVFRSSQGWPPDDSVAVAVAQSEDLQLPPEVDRQAFADRLAPLLNIPQLQHLAKAFDLGTAHERSVRNLRIITDIRPIFEDDPEHVPSTAVISHNLMINTYGDAGNIQTTVVTMDAADLESLRLQAERAQQKAKTIRSVLSQLEVTIQDLEKQ